MELESRNFGLTEPHIAREPQVVAPGPHHCKLRSYKTNSNN